MHVQHYGRKNQAGPTGHDRSASSLQLHAVDCRPVVTGRPSHALQDSRHCRPVMTGRPGEFILSSKVGRPVMTGRPVFSSAVQQGVLPVVRPVGLDNSTVQQRGPTGRATSRLVVWPVQQWGPTGHDRSAHANGPYSCLPSAGRSDRSGPVGTGRAGPFSARFTTVGAPFCFI